MASSDEATAPLIREATRGGVLVATIDMPGRTMNVFSAALMQALQALLQRVESDAAVKALVLTSGKATFVAGADLEMVKGFTQAGASGSRAALNALCGELGRLFSRLEALTKPTVAAINGLALGGGLELTLACDRRLVADDPRIQLGLPEIKLGLLPGAGGTQRLPRIVGAETGLDMLLSGQPAAPADALRIGLVDEVVPADRLLDRAVAVADGLARDGGGRAPLGPLPSGPFDFAAGDAVRQVTRRFGYADEMVAAYPAYDAIVRSVIEGARLSAKEGSEIEMERFVDLMQNEVAGNMVATLFLNRQKADKRLQSYRGPKAVRFAFAGDDAESDRALRAGLETARATIIAPAQAGPDDVVVGTSAAQGADLILLAAGEEREEGAVGVALAGSRAYGTAIEILADESDGARLDKALALARALRATPFVHSGRAALLPALAELERRAIAAGADGATVLAAKARRAQSLAAAADGAMADVACVVGGVFPAFAGGPFAYLARREPEIAVIEARNLRAGGLFS